MKFGTSANSDVYKATTEISKWKPLTIYEAIDLFTADLYLYPRQQRTKGWLKYLKERKKALEASGRLDEFERKYTGSTNLRRGSKTIYDSRVEGSVIEVPPQAKSPYVDEADNEKP